MPEVRNALMLIGTRLMTLSAPFGPPNTSAAHSGSLMFAVQVLRIRFWLTVAIWPVKFKLYQSSEKVNPGIQCGVRTTPPETVRATSGASVGLPNTLLMIDADNPVLGSVALPVLTFAGANRSWTVGARISTDQTERSLMSSLSWLVKPSFQVWTPPEVE